MLQNLDDVAYDLLSFDWKHVTPCLHKYISDLLGSYMFFRISYSKPSWWSCMKIKHFSATGFCNIFWLINLFAWFPFYVILSSIMRLITFMELVWLLDWIKNYSWVIVNACPRTSLALRVCSQIWMVVVLIPFSSCASTHCWSYRPIASFSWLPVQWV